MTIATTSVSQSKSRMLKRKRMRQLRLGCDRHNQTASAHHKTMNSTHFAASKNSIWPGFFGERSSATHISLHGVIMAKNIKHARTRLMSAPHAAGKVSAA